MFQAPSRHLCQCMHLRMSKSSNSSFCKTPRGINMLCILERPMMTSCSVALGSTAVLAATFRLEWVAQVSKIETWATHFTLEVAFDGLLHANSRFNRQTRPQQMILILGSICQVDSHRNPLHHLHIIARGILRRK
jgi:hypothetical protein